MGVGCGHYRPIGTEMKILVTDHPNTSASTAIALNRRVR